MDTNILTVALLAAISMGGLVYALLYDRIAMENAREKRVGTIRSATIQRPQGGKATTKSDRRASVQSTIEDIERQQKRAGKVTLKRSLQQAGLVWSIPTYLLVCLLCGVLAAAVAFWAGLGPLGAVVAAPVGALLVPKLYIARRRKKRLEAFLQELPNAVDVIVRGIKSGLPLNDCLNIVAREASEPVRSEFARVMESQAAGVPIPSALERMYERMPLAETNFLAIVVGIQATSGGSMSEALNNLSEVLRDRKKMKGKIQAMSMEAKASAGVIGSLPVVVAGLVQVVAPDYLETLFVTTLGNVLLAGAAIWMGIGVLIMKKMINFDF